MAEDKSKYVDAVTKLIQLTQESKIQWQSGDKQKFIKEHPDYPVEGLFIADYKGKTLRLYQYSYKRPICISDTSFVSAFANEYVRVVTTILEVIDYYENILWTFPTMNALSDLYKSVQSQIAGLKTLIDELSNDSN